MIYTYTQTSNEKHTKHCWCSIGKLAGKSEVAKWNQSAILSEQSLAILLVRFGHYKNIWQNVITTLVQTCSYAVKELDSRKNATGKQIFIEMNEMYVFNRTKRDLNFLTYSLIPLLLYQYMVRNKNFSTNWKKSFFLVKHIPVVLVVYLKLCIFCM